MDIPTKTLCALSALKDETPDAILELIQGASAEQICKMCTLVEGYDDPTEPEKVAARDRKRRRRSKKDSSAKSGGDPKKKAKKKKPKEQLGGDFRCHHP